MDGASAQIVNRAKPRATVTNGLKSREMGKEMGQVEEGEIPLSLFHEESNGDLQCAHIIWEVRQWHSREAQ
jgi:hypothetical protein